MSLVSAAGRVFSIAKGLALIGEFRVRHMTFSSNGTEIPLHPGEHLLGLVAADGFHASKHGATASTPQVALTDQRFVLIETRGMFWKKRLEEIVSWPLASFTERLNTSEGAALGAGRYVVTLFAKDGETVSTGFRDSRARDAFKELVVEALGPLLS